MKSRLSSTFLFCFGEIRGGGHSLVGGPVPLLIVVQVGAKPLGVSCLGRYAARGGPVPRLIVVQVGSSPVDNRCPVYPFSYHRPSGRRRTFQPSPRWASLDPYSRWKKMSCLKLKNENVFILTKNSKYDIIYCKN